ncbi:GIY-YIG nuclease family protein [Streptomyces sp. NPDC059496]|uniref:GIY-YIG nuclease family protein n=1 Tax=Streptomyces sp. NPDC059496 TaxID=3346851 RepID=UPI0036B614E2
MSLSAQSFVYVIGPPGSNRVKIGTSVNPGQRLKELQTGNPDVLEIRWTTPGGRELETALHQAFAAYRTAGEWFDFGDVDPVGAIPRATHLQAGPGPQLRGRSKPAPRPGARPSAREEAITPEQLAGIVRDVVLGVVRENDDDGDEDEVEEPITRPHRLHRVNHDMERLTEAVHGGLAARHAQRIVAGKTWATAFADWPSLLLLALTVPVAVPIAAFLGLRLYTRDIWPIRKLPLLVALGWVIWDPLGFDALIRDQVFSRLPMEAIVAFAHTYFTQAAVTIAWFLGLFGVVICMVGYTRQVSKETQALREARTRAAAEKKAARTNVAAPRSPHHPYPLPPATLIADLIQAIPPQATRQDASGPHSPGREHVEEAGANPANPPEATT